VRTPIDNHVVSARLLGHRDLLVRRDTPDDTTAPQLDDLGQQQPHASRSAEGRFAERALRLTRGEGVPQPVRTSN
jgi:hypothetical protein